LNVLVDKSFEIDINKLQDVKLRAKIADVIELMINAQQLKDIKSVKKLKGGHLFFRIKIQDYRIGLIYEDDKIILVRFLHRKDIYQFFPD